MNIQVLPHIFKKIGLFLFIAYPVGHFLSGFFYPFQSNEETDLLHPYLAESLEIGALIGVIIYFISKEKVEDELVKRIRLESMSIAFLLSIGTLLLLSITSINIDVVIMFLIQLTLFLIIYHYQKRSFDL